ncbi:xanthine dehydrogenase subunit XdhA [Pseudodesulfovibrio senegalensis]|uniref:Xanthine dehydrogenase molybdenum-binding subunit XdhA n=1 Tax=Pseudodesulfovibrio senegalensis TaxID=1721087 RepID=A0A6N6N4X8_9BACT|nr:xanthine dehydrogenase subunit XdhA [Pseudodesulfovibrio senegalensis]KAB1443124.1 xanthine dehydrogenase molybdenum-binding subunit XdhA [Pseudodesulfovibrio senegalensis]
MTVGSSPIRKDAVAKVTGKARYTDDFTMPGMLHAAYVRSSIAHGTVTNIDISKALAMDGVEAIFTYEDVPDILFATAGHPYSLDPDHTDVADRLLLTREVRYHGDEIAVVVAETKLAAKEAARAVLVEYEELPVCVDAASALDENAPAIHKGGNVIKSHQFEVGGDLETAIREADSSVSGQYYTPVVQHCHMENHIAYAYMDDFEHVVVVTSTQIPHICRRVVGQALDMPWGNVRIIKPYIGGGFGNKQDVVLEPMVAFLTTKLDGRPVKLELDREECMTSTRTRHSSILDCRAAADRDGTLRAVDIAMTSNTGAYASHGHSIPSAGGAKSCNLYPRNAIRFSALTHYANIPAAGAMRAYGSPQVIFGLECVLEDLAREIGMDSVDFRIKNVARELDVNPLSNKPIRSAGMVECLEKGRELIRWDEKKRRFAHQQGPVRRGLGVACFSYGSGTYPVCVEIAGCRLILNQDGSVHMQVGATEIGQGSDTAFAQMAAETLGVSYDKIHVVTTQDTDVAPFDTGAYASRQTYVVAPAIKKAALQLKAAILDHARKMTGKAAEGLDVVDGNVVNANRPERVVTSLAELAIDAYYHKQRGGQLTADVSHKTRTNAPSFGCTFVDLEVDIPMCKVRVHQILNVHDAGTIIHPLLAEGQVHGGMGMAVGMALYEELLTNPENGRVLNNNLLDYKIPTCVDTPDLGCAFVETTEPTGAYGNKSLGEPPVISPGPAIRNAILDATGVAVNRMPMSPKALFTHFHDAGLI